MRRIVILGGSGSGKSTLARELGEILDLPVIHLDALFWQPGWVEPEAEQFRAAVEAALRGDAWITDGNYSTWTFDLRVPAADTIIYLDMPRLLCVRRVVWRSLRNFGRTRSDLGAGCPERLSWEFIRWTWMHPVRHRDRILSEVRRHAQGKEVIVLRRPKEVRRFLAEVRRRGADGALEAERAHRDGR